MSNPLTIEEFRRFSSTFEEILKRNLNDRFDHYEKRAVQRESSAHRELMGGFGEVISTVNDHMDERFKDVDTQFKSVDGQFKKVDEQFKGVNEQFKNVDVQFRSVGEQFINVDAQFKNVGEQFKNVDKQFKNVDAQFKSIEQKMDKGFTAIERQLDSLVAQHELRKEFDALVSFVASKYNLSVAEIIGQSIK